MLKSDPMRLLVLLLLVSSNACKLQTDLRLLTYNLRLDTPADGVNQWPNRKETVAALLQKHGPDIFGVQEALHHQMTDLELLLHDYAWYGAGRDDAKTSGEYSAIFYKKEKFTLLQSGTFWLSETPEVPGSKSWDAAITRICSWGEFHEKTTGGKFFVFNTHFDHVGEMARLESMKLISEKVKKIAGEAPFVLMGDFNFEPTAPPYATVNDTAHWNISDTYLAAEKNESEKPCTFTGFKVEGADCRRIDYIFTSEKIRVKTFNIITENDGTHFPSDHLPVTAVVTF